MSSAEHRSVKTRMKFRAVLVASLMVFCSEAACPPTWHSHGRSCYYVSLDEKASWPQAQMYCRVFGGYLVDINSAEEEHFVRGLATWSNGLIVWVGATDIQEEGVWRSAHTARRLDFIGTWAPKEPNDGPAGNCLCLWRDSRYQWGDHNCNHRDVFLCERPASIPAVLTSNVITQ